jgi:hypothetical protein
MLVLAVWFTRRSSTGSLRVRSNKTEYLTSAAPATVSGRYVFLNSKNAPAFIYTTETLEFWEGDEGSSISPDTGQQGGCALF